MHVIYKLNAYNAMKITVHLILWTRSP